VCRLFGMNGGPEFLSSATGPAERRGAGGPSAERLLAHAGAAGTVRVRGSGLSQRPAVAIASERADGDPGRREPWPAEGPRMGSRLRLGPQDDHPPADPA
jgi:hypothetical protein